MLHSRQVLVRERRGKKMLEYASMTYFERQSGSNCRIHAINNLAGEQALSIADFDAYNTSYTQQQEVLNRNPNEINFASTCSWDRSSLLSYILWNRFKLQCFTIGQYELPRFKKAGVVRTLLDVMDHDLDRFFVSNTSHVWCVKRCGDDWYCFDSMKRGPQKTTLAKWEHASYTLTFPWTEGRCRQGVYEMQKLVRTYFKGMSSNHICSLVMEDLMLREPSHFGDCQNWIAHFYRFLHIISPSNYKRQISRFRKYETASKLDILNAMNNLPDIILFIVHYK